MVKFSVYLNRRVFVMESTSLKFMPHLRIKMWKQAPEEWVISEVKLTVKFYSLRTSIRMVARVDNRLNAGVNVGRRTNGRTETCTPKSHMLTQVRQKSPNIFLNGIVFATLGWTLWLTYTFTICILKHLYNMIFKFKPNSSFRITIW